MSIWKFKSAHVNLVEMCVEKLPSSKQKVANSNKNIDFARAEITSLDVSPNSSAQVMVQLGCQSLKSTAASEIPMWKRGKLAPFSQLSLKIERVDEEGLCTIQTFRFAVVVVVKKSPADSAAACSFINCKPRTPVCLKSFWWGVCSIFPPFHKLKDTTFVSISPLFSKSYFWFINSKNLGKNYLTNKFNSGFVN